MRGGREGRKVFSALNLTQIVFHSFVRWGFQGLMINEFKDNAKIFPPYTITHHQVTTQEQYENFAETYGFENYDKWFSFPVLVMNMLVFRVLTFFALRHFKYEKR